jgi:MFS family permease
MPEEHRVMSFSMFRIALNIGAAAGSLLAVVLIALNWDLLFWFNGLTALAYSGLALALLPRTSHAADYHAEDAAGGQLVQEAGYGVVLRDVRFLVYLASMLLSAVVYIQFYAVLPLKISAEGHPTSLYNAVLVLDSVLLITLELKITTYTRRGMASVVGGIGTTLLALGFAGYGLPFASTAVIVVSTLVFVFGIMVSGPTMFAYPAKKPAAKGRYIGASQAMFSLGSAAGPAVGALAWSHIGNWIWPICGVVGLVAAACAVIGMQERPEPAPTT